MTGRHPHERPAGLAAHQPLDTSGQDYGPPANSIAGSVERKQRDAFVEDAVEQKRHRDARRDADIRRAYYGTGDEVDQRRAKAAAAYARGDIDLDMLAAINREIDGRAPRARARARGAASWRTAPYA